MQGICQLCGVWVFDYDLHEDFHNRVEHKNVTLWTPAWAPPPEER